MPAGQRQRIYQLVPRTGDEIHRSNCTLCRIPKLKETFMKDEQLMQVLRRLLESEDKPKECTPTDLLQTVRFLVQHSAESGVSISRGTLSVQLGCGESAIYESQQRLKNFGWLAVQKGKRRGAANRFTLLIDKLPLGDLKKTVISDEMRELARSYQTLVKACDRTKRFMKGSLQVYAFRLETLLSKCGGDEKVLREIIKFAFGRPEFYAKAMRGPHELRKSWRSLKGAFDHFKMVETLLAYLTWEAYLRRPLMEKPSLAD